AGAAVPGAGPGGRAERGGGRLLLPAGRGDDVPAQPPGTAGAGEDTAGPGGGVAVRRPHPVLRRLPQTAGGRGQGRGRATPGRGRAPGGPGRPVVTRLKEVWASLRAARRESVPRP